jgi:hypothetical protein
MLSPALARIFYPFVSLSHCAMLLLRVLNPFFLLAYSLALPTLHNLGTAFSPHFLISAKWCSIDTHTCMRRGRPSQDASGWGRKKRLFLVCVRLPSELKKGLFIFWVIYELLRHALTLPSTNLAAPASASNGDERQVRGVRFNLLQKSMTIFQVLFHLTVIDEADSCCMLIRSKYE